MLPLANPFLSVCWVSDGLSDRSIICISYLADSGHIGMYDYLTLLFYEKSMEIKNTNIQVSSKMIVDNY